MDSGMKFAFALDGLIRSRVKGDGGEDFARKCITEIGESVEMLFRTAWAPPAGHDAHLRDALRRIQDTAEAETRRYPGTYGWPAVADIAANALGA